MNEFALIQQFFNKQNSQNPSVILGIGDDAAILKIPPKQQLVVTTDTLVCDVHFKKKSPPHAIGYKSLAVNLSDIAAMGADPAWFTLALTIPHSDEHWLHEFSRGLFELATRFHVPLIGGDLTHGPLSITIQAFGLLPDQTALRRDQAKVGDLIYVTHTLGDAAFELQDSLERDPSELRHLYYPEPRVAYGQKLRSIAHAAIDISDGLLADLGHLLEQSQVGASVNVDCIPLSPTLQALPKEKALTLAATGGDDYELCFTVPKEKKHLLDMNCTLIGEITATRELDLHEANGKKYHFKTLGYQHF